MLLKDPPPAKLGEEMPEIIADLKPHPIALDVPFSALLPRV
jgi:hypothetical protein